jgi:hypothetical protein
MSLITGNHWLWFEGRATRIPRSGLVQCWDIQDKAIHRFNGSIAFLNEPIHRKRVATIGARPDEDLQRLESLVDVVIEEFASAIER